MPPGGLPRPGGHQRVRPMPGQPWHLGVAGRERSGRHRPVHSAHGRGGTSIPGTSPQTLPFLRERRGPGAPAVDVLLGGRTCHSASPPHHPGSTPGGLAGCPGGKGPPTPHADMRAPGGQRAEQAQPQVDRSVGDPRQLPTAETPHRGKAQPPPPCPPRLRTWVLSAVLSLSREQAG